MVSTAASGSYPPANAANNTNTVGAKAIHAPAPPNTGLGEHRYSSVTPADANSNTPGICTYRATIAEFNAKSLRTSFDKGYSSSILTDARQYDPDR